MSAEALLRLFAAGAATWIAIAIVATAIPLLYLAYFLRRQKHRREQFEEAREAGLSKPAGQFPYIDPELCIGCGNCVAVCPEGDVLGLVGGQAVVQNGARCIGIANCQDACPVGAIEVGLGDIKGRADLPVLDDSQQTTVPGVYIAGELGGLSLVRNAIEQGSRTVREVAVKLEERRGDQESDAAASRDAGVVDLLIVGSGPAGMSAALTATELGLDYLVLEQESSLGGTIDHYPRQKIVHTQPVEVPLYGWLRKAEQSKEELLELFSGLCEKHDLQIRFGERVAGFSRRDGHLIVESSSGETHCRYLVLAIGRRGTPRKLGIPGEALPKVFYQVRDAEQYRGRKIVCVGGGDSAVEAAMGLSAQPGNEVVLSYRKSRFARIKRKNQERIENAIERGAVRAVFESNLREIRDDQVLLEAPDGEQWLENDLVFIFAGGVPPYPLLRGGGIQFGDDL